MISWIVWMCLDLDDAIINSLNCSSKTLVGAGRRSRVGGDHCACTTNLTLRSAQGPCIWLYLIVFFCICMHGCCPPNAHWKASAFRWTPWTIFTYFYRAWFGCGIWRHHLCAAPSAVPSLREPCSILAFSVVLVLNAPTNTWKLRLAPFCQLGAKWCFEAQRRNTLDDSIDSLHHEPTWFSYVFHFSIVFNCVPAR